MFSPSFRPAAALATILVAFVWLLALVPTGLALHDLASFAALGTILWTAFSATAHVLARRDWAWRAALRAAILGAAVLPPVIAVLVAIAGVERPQQLLSLFVYGAWLTVAAGAITGLLHRPNGHRRREFVRRSAAVVRERVLQRPTARRFWRDRESEPLLVRADVDAGAPQPRALNREPDGTPERHPR